MMQTHQELTEELRQLLDLSEEAFEWLFEELPTSALEILVKKLKRSDSKASCTWTWDQWHEYFDTSCDHPYCTEPDEIEKGIFKFCPYCGKTIKAKIEHDTETP